MTFVIGHWKLSAEGGSWGYKGFDGKLSIWQAARRGRLTNLVNFSANVINADAKQLIADTQAMGLNAFKQLIGYQPAEVLQAA